MGQDLLFKGTIELQAHRDRVTRWNRAIEEGTIQDVSREYYEEIQGLDSKCAAAEIALNTCKFSPQPTEEETNALEEALSDLGRAIDDFRNRFRGGRDD